LLVSVISNFSNNVKPNVAGNIRGRLWHGIYDDPTMPEYARTAGETPSEDNPRDNGTMIMNYLLDLPETTTDLADEDMPLIDDDDNEDEGEMRLPVPSASYIQIFAQLQPTGSEVELGMFLPKCNYHYVVNSWK
jgi:hypothetical protein